MFKTVEPLTSQIYLGDCLDVLPMLPDNSVDLILTDPPYGYNYLSRSHKLPLTKIANDDQEAYGLLDKALAIAWHKLKPDRHVYIFTNWQSYEQMAPIVRKYFKQKGALIWVKNNRTRGDLKGNYGYQHEDIMYFHKGRRWLFGRRDSDVLLFDKVPTQAMRHPTEKPLKLLEYLISKSTEEGEVVLDPFCGSGTAIVAAQKLGRRWIGIDNTHLSIGLQKARLENMFPDTKIAVIGTPQEISAARHLAQENRDEFQWWVLSLIHAKPYRERSDKGFDGVIAFIDDNTDKVKRVLVEVRSGHVNSSHIRDLKGILQRENAAIGIFLTLKPPSKDMLKEAVSAGFYHSPGWNKDYPRIQILTIEELLHNAEVKMPPQFGTFKQAQRVQQSTHEQPELGLSTG